MNLTKLRTSCIYLQSGKKCSLTKVQPFNTLFNINITNYVSFSSIIKFPFLLSKIERNTGNTKKLSKCIMIKLFDFKNNNMPTHNYNLRPRPNKNISQGSVKEIVQKFSSDSVIDVFPLQTLKNFFITVSNNLGSPSSKLIEEGSILEVKPSIYLSTLNLFWPKPLTFSSYGINKKDATRNAAKNALYWLKDNTFMDCRHNPILNVQVLNSVSSGKRFYSTCASKLTNVKDDQSIEKENIKPEPAPAPEPEQIKTIKSLFPFPKGVLHSCFTLLSNELKERELHLSPVYKTVKISKKNSLWECTYNLKWPEAKKFSATATRKQDASHKAAIEALDWLYHNGKIDAKGNPNIYPSGDVPQLKKKYTELKLSGKALNHMTNIVESIQNHNVQKILQNYTNFSEKESLSLTEEWVEPDVTRKHMNLDFYAAKEPVHLPISDYKENLIDLLKENSVVIVKGEPGCGKSTRVPQYVLEAWSRDAAESNSLCRIVVTQPRRLAAVSLAERVAYERNERVGSTIGYHIRFNNNFSKKTGYIMYCTTGILLNRLQSDPKLSDCSHIILDEAHERDVNIDLLMNLIRHALVLNPKLKVLVMSATMDAEMFQKYFDNAAILNIPGFTYPVEEYFLTDKSLETYEMCFSKFPQVIPKDVVNCIKYIDESKPEGAILCFLPGWEDITRVKNLMPQRTDMVTLCLHSRLSLADQKKIFSKPPPGVRKIILATNIAETSVTIDDVVYVIDTGIHKEERLDAQKGVLCIDNHWISKASAKQRKGRAGRCQSGECYHLYPESHYQTFLDYSIPEILRTSLTKIVLDSKVYSNNMKAVEFLEQLICPPDKAAIESAIQELKELELLDENENLTPLGRTLSNFQLHPKLGKAMVNSVVFKCVSPIIDIVTLYSDDTALFSNDLVDKQRILQNLQKQSKTSDHLAMMQLFEKWLYYIESKDFATATRMCKELGLVQPKLLTLQKLRNVHVEYLHKGLSDVLPISDDFSDDYELVKAVLLSGVGNILRRRDWDIVKGRQKKKTILLTRHNHRATITSASVNTRKSPPNFLVYINETISNLRRTSLIRETSSVSPLSVLLFGIGEIQIEDLNSGKICEESDDKVLMKLGKSGIEFQCDKSHAVTIKECKEVLETYKKYYIYQLTTGNGYSLVINTTWKEVLKNVRVVLKDDV
ncbi:hypothetical protein RI129_004000 [Pyrocoelia pectoralis]|uniref:RNA helicase n=1 Tax=Pyrocoelia pectoralis TaxID=417401 RepID=A0AAN7VTI9_9COLE